MIYLAFFKSLITTIKPIFFRFFSIIKYLVLVLLAILLYLLVGRVGAINLNTLSESIRFQHEFTGHIYGLEHIPYHEKNLYKGDLGLGQELLPVGNLLRSNYYYTKGYKVVLGRSYSSNFISGLMVTKKGTFKHTIGYPYGVDKLQTFDIPADGFLGGLANIFSSSKFKNVVAHNFGFTFYNERSNDNYLEVTSHMCGKEYPGYIITYMSSTLSTNTGSVDSGLRVYDLKNNLLYVYKDVGNQHNGPNSGGCGVVNYFSEKADVVRKIRIIYGYQKGVNFLYDPVYNYGYQTGRYSQVSAHSETFHDYWGFHLVEKIAEKKAPEQYQVEHEKEKDQYQSSPAYNTCQDDYNHVVSQSFSLINCKVFSQLHANQNTGFNYFNELLKDATQPFDGTGVSFLVGGEDPFKYVGYPDELKACKVRVEQENKYYKTKVDVPDSTGFIPDVEKRMMQYKIILKKQFLQTYSNASPMPSINDYCGYNTQYANSNVNNNPIDIKTQLKNDWEEIVSFINSGSYGRSGAIKDTRPIYVRIGEDLKNKYLNIQKKTFVSGLNNYCKENGNQFANNIYYFIIFLFGFYFIKMFK